METLVFVVAAVVSLAGSIGVVASRNPVHSALMLILTLFGVAVLFVAQEAHFLAAVQVVVYAGAIVVLFLFVIMLLGVDRAENLSTEPLGGQRPAAGVIAILSLGLIVLLAVRGAQVATGEPSTSGTLGEGGLNVAQLGRALFTDFVFAFEATSALLVIAVVAAVVLARKPVAADEEVAAPVGGAEQAQPEPHAAER
jgi:NADH-quinone oxidoreductase subunit J